MNTQENGRRWWGRLRWVLIAVALGVFAWLAYVDRADLTRQALVDTVNALHPAVFILAYLILPLLGVPATIFYLAAGVRFGLPLGGLVSGVCILFHHLVGYWIAQGPMRRVVRHWLEKPGHSLPKIKAHNQVEWTALFSAIAGPPYALKLYLLPLAGVSYRIYLLVAMPIHVVMCLPVVAAGGSLGSVNAVWVTVAGVSIVLLVLLTAWLKRHYSRSQGDS